jgi:hypothetical protein
MLTWIALVAAIGYAAARVFAGYPRAPGRRILAAREVALVTAVADAMFPRGGPVAASGSEARVPERLDEHLAILPSRIRRLVRMLFFLIEHATLLFPPPPPRGRRRFSSLSEAQRAAALEGWRTSRFPARRLVFAALRAVVTNAYVADPAVLRQLGLAPFAIETPVLEPDLLYPRVGLRPETIPYTRASLTPPSDGSPLDPASPRDPRFAEPRA